MMQIKSRLLLLTIAMTTMAILVSLLVSSYLTREALVAGAEEKLSAVLEARYSALLRHLDTTRQELRVLAATSSSATMLSELSEGFSKLGRNAQTLLQQQYVEEKGGQHKASPLLDTDFGRAYDAASAFYLQRQQNYDWDDMFLVDPQGNVVFSIGRRKDFGTNLLSGTWKDSGLARAVKPLLHDAVPGVMSFADFEHYAPADNRSAAFIAMPVFDSGKKTFVGVVAIQLPVHQINEIMKDKTGLGDTGETFVVGREGWMLTDSRFRKENSVLGVQLKTAAVSKVLQGQSGLEQLPDYRGIEAYVAFKSLKPFAELGTLGDHAQWGVIAKIDRDEELEEYYDLRRMLLWTGLGLTALAFAVGVRGALSITRPLLGIRDALSRLARGESAEVPSLGRRDEIGEMAKAAEAFREMTQKVERDHWIAENVTVLTSAVSNEASMDKAADRVLHLLCEKLELPVGAIYLSTEGVYRRIGSHGLARRSQAEDTFAPGVGLVGQCAKDNQATVLSPVPEGLSIISTGLAEFPPQELILYPIAHKSEVLAVVELAAAKSLSAAQHDFLQAAASALGLYLANLQASEHNLFLLVETRKQSKELKEQQESLLRSNEEMHALSEELRSQAEEMKSQNEELKANQEELRAQQEEMRHKNQMLETQSGQLAEVLAQARSKAEDLERANQYKSEFLANMSHELRTPLNSVLILSRSLAENDEKNLTPEQIESATVISESGTQLLTLINDILDLSKIEAGKLELVKEKFRIDEFLAYLRRLFSAQAEKKQLDFNIVMDPSLPETIDTDRQRLTQILSNLLSNALKFTDSGEVSIKAGLKDDQLQFEVRDTGIGIPEDKLEHIFGAFQQVDGSTSRKYGGSGLGLAISRHLAQLLGGEIRVKSTLGKGSSFIVSLPVGSLAPMLSAATATPEAPVAAAVEEVAGNRRGSIMVVEDDVQLLSILGRMIKALGFTALCVESAEQAMESIANEMPLGILLDLGLPHMNGMELLRRLKADASTAQIPVYIMSGGTDTGEAKTLGALDFLKKPVTRDTIAGAVRSMLSMWEKTVIKRVLLIDGNTADIKSLRELFKNDALELISATSGGDATALLKSQHFDTVVLDLQLPDMSGFEWLKQACHLLNPPPVVVYSARELSEEEVFELKAVAESIVTKSAQNDRLRQEVLLAANLEKSAGKMTTVENEAVSGKKLLLVDDDARNLFALTRVLRSKGFVIEVAPNSVAALALLNETRFDAVLTDIMMPDMDGYELIRKIRSLGYADLPLIAITAKAMQGDDELCLQAGANAYLSKPVDMSKLFELLKEI